MLASGSLDCTVVVWRASTGEALYKYDYGKPIASIAFNQAGNLLVVAAGHKVFCWHYQQPGEPLRILKTRRSLRALHFHPLAPHVLLTAEVTERRGTNGDPGLAVRQPAAASAGPNPQAAVDHLAAFIAATNNLPQPLPQHVPTANAVLGAGGAVAGVRLGVEVATAQAMPGPGAAGSAPLRGANGGAAVSGAGAAAPAAGGAAGGAGAGGGGGGASVGGWPGVPNLIRNLIQGVASVLGSQGQQQHQHLGTAVPSTAHGPIAAAALAAGAPSVNADVAATAVNAGGGHGGAAAPAAAGPRPLAVLAPADIMRHQELGRGVRHAIPLVAPAAAAAAGAGAEGGGGHEGSSSLAYAAPGRWFADDHLAAYDLSWGWDHSFNLSETEVERLRARAVMMAPSLPSADNQDTPCIVTLRLWDFHDTTRELTHELLAVPKVVLCSEMGVHFSPCGRYMACCVVPKHATDQCLEWYEAQAAAARAAAEAAMSETHCRPAYEGEGDDTMDLGGGPASPAGSRRSCEMTDAYDGTVGGGDASVAWRGQQQPDLHDTASYTSHQVQATASVGGPAYTAVSGVGGASGPRVQPAMFASIQQQLAQQRHAAAAAATAQQQQASAAPGRGGAAAASVAQAPPPPPPGTRAAAAGGWPHTRGQGAGGSAPGRRSRHGSHNGTPGGLGIDSMAAAAVSHTSYELHIYNVGLSAIYATFTPGASAANAAAASPSLEGGLLAPASSVAMPAPLLAPTASVGGGGGAASVTARRPATSALTAAVAAAAASAAAAAALVPAAASRAPAARALCASFGSLHLARPIAAAHCMTSVQFSPTGEHLLIAYGRRHISLCSLVASAGQLAAVHSVVEVYSLPDLSLRRVLLSAEDEVNVAVFNCYAGEGLVYGTKEGRLRLLRYDRQPPRRSAIPFIHPAGQPDDELWEAEQQGRSVSASEADAEL